MAINRRQWLRGAAALGLVPSLGKLVGCAEDEAQSPKDAAPPSEDAQTWDAGAEDAALDAEPPLDAAPEDAGDAEVVEPELGPFQHGVASGDPLSDRVILWTRVTVPEAQELTVRWAIAADEALTQIVAQGQAQTSAAVDFTVKVDAEGLAAATTYYYGFWLDEVASPVGRTRTAPAGPVDRVDILFCSCAAMDQGELHAYEGMARREADVVLHLGDYIYEYASKGPVILYDPPYETVTLSDYRRRYAWYRRFAQLQHLHARHPMICVWDDHEHANNAYRDGAKDHDEARSGPWSDRKAASIQAWHEWLPVRSGPDRERIYRRFQYGDLIDLFMLDTRLYGRDESSSTFDPEQTMLGAEQERWLYEGLEGSEAVWKVLGQQVMMASWRIGTSGAASRDSWDGFLANRARLLEVIEAGEVQGVVVTTGDIHTSWANHVALDPFDPQIYDPETGAGTICTEFVCPSIASRALGMLTPAISELIQESNLHVQWFELTKKGFVSLRFDRAAVRADWWLYETIRVADYPEPYWAAGFSCTPTDPRLRRHEGPDE